MSGLRVPEKKAENPSASQREFPAGEWLWEIEEVRVREIDPSANPRLNWMFEPNDNGNRRYAGPTATTIGIQLGKAQPLADNQDDVGDKKFFVDITLKDGEVYVDEIGENAQETMGVGYQICVDGALFTNLALALGQAYKQDGYVYPSDDFRAKLEDGSLKGMRIAGKTKERHFTKRDGSKGSKVELEYFSPAS